jgi:TatD DNase family protein
VIIDSHCHLDDDAFDADRAAVFERARAAGVRGFVLAGVDPATWPKQRALALSERGVVWSAGLHPMRAATFDDAATRSALAELVACFEGVGPARALGETGLDTHFVPRDSIARQLEVFREQLALARSFDLPVVLHILGRGTHLHSLELMRRDGVPTRGGVVHSYSGSAELAEEYVALGLSISFSGSVCRPAAERAHRAAASVPLDRLLIETDSPDLAPPGRGPRNEPTAVLDVAAAVAKIRGIECEDLLIATAANASRLFGAFE